MNLHAHISTVYFERMIGAYLRNIGIFYCQNKYTLNTINFIDLTTLC